MTKERKHMYDVTVKERKKNTIYNSGFFLNVQDSDKKDVEIMISHKVLETLGYDMQRRMNLMAEMILEGLIDGGK